MQRWTAVILVVLGAAQAQAHDTWVQTNTNLVRVGDVIHIDLMLGNHGNDHRDFKLASKLSLEEIQTFAVLAPDGKSYDLKPALVDQGYAPKEGYYTARFVGGKAGLYVVGQTTDAVHHYGAKPTRVYKSGKTYFVLTPTLDKVPRNHPGFDKPLGHTLELVADTNPVTPMGPGTPIQVKLLFEGKPLAGIKVSFIPRGVALKQGLDDTYERLTDQEGRARFTPRTGTYYLVVAHYHRPDQKGAKYDSTSYAATLTVYVPEVCPCCSE